MSLEKARNYLSKLGLDKNIIEFSISTATVSEAAEALGCSDAMIAKTMAFFVHEEPILIVASGNRKIDNSKFKKVFCTKAKMIFFARLESLIGYSAGGVCPFGINDGVKVYLDVSLKEFDVVYPAAGTSNSAVKLSLQELEKASNYVKYIDVCKPFEN